MRLADRSKNIGLKLIKIKLKKKEPPRKPSFKEIFLFDNSKNSGISGGATREHRLNGGATRGGPLACHASALPAEL